MYFRQTNSDFERKNRNLDKQTAPFETIKHQRDKQISLFIALIFNCLIYSKSINTPPR